MSLYVKIFVVCILIFLTYRFVRNYQEIEYITSDLDNKVYMIRRGYSKSKEFLLKSANTLADINKRVEKLIEFLEKNYSDDPNKNYFIKKLRENYNSYMISEASLDLRYTTYTVDKQDMHICLRTRDQYENVYDIDLLMYVVLHELAHLCNYNKFGTPIIGHGFEFKFVFKFLVEEAIKIGIYKYTDYSRNPHEYCGIKISSSIL
jgi:hypothetical protein